MRRYHGVPYCPCGITVRGDGIHPAIDIEADQQPRSIDQRITLRRAFVSCCFSAITVGDPMFILGSRGLFVNKAFERADREASHQRS